MQRTRSYRTRLVVSHAGLAVGVLLLAFGALYRVLDSALEYQLDERLTAQARGAAQWAGGGRHPNVLAQRIGMVVNARVTVVDTDGVVLGDSGLPDGQAPPATRLEGLAEIEAARTGSVGFATRAGLDGTPMRFVAVPTDDGLVVRMAVPLSSLAALRQQLRGWFLLCLVVALLLAVGLGIVAGGRAVRPLREMTGAASRIAAGDYDIQLVAGPDEFGTLSSALASLAAQLRARISELTGERDRLGAILNTMVEGVVVVDGQGAITRANASAARLVGRALEGQAYADAFAGTPLVAALAAGEAAELSIQLPPDREAVANLRPLASTAGGGMVAVLHDVTRLRKLERVRRDFVANVSHELRTPVAAVAGFSETLLRGNADEATRTEFLETIHRHAQRLGRLVADLLTLSALDAAPEPMHRESFSVAEVVAHAVDALGAAARQRQIVLNTNVLSTLLAIGDAHGAEQVVTNLLENAVKYGKDNGVVMVAARQQGNAVVLSVEDDGPGIPDEHQPRVFERFYRVANSDGAADVRGTGLGLAIVKGTVEAMGGTIALSSKPGRTVFEVTLPGVGVTEAWERGS